MPFVTPKFLLKAPSETSQFRNLGKELRELALSIESVLTSFNYNGRDPNAVLARVVALENKNAGTPPPTSELIRPSSIVGGKLASDGSVILNEGSTRLAIDRVFSSEFRSYRIESMLNFSAAAGTRLRLRRSGSNHAVARYTSQRLSVSGTNATASQSASQTSWPAAGIAQIFVRSTWLITGPAHEGPKFYEGVSQIAPGAGFAEERGFLADADNAVFDGFEWTSDAAIASTPSWIKIYGNR